MPSGFWSWRMSWPDFLCIWNSSCEKIEIYPIFTHVYSTSAGTSGESSHWVPRREEGEWGHAPVCSLLWSVILTVWLPLPEGPVPQSPLWTDSFLHLIAFFHNDLYTFTYFFFFGLEFFFLPSHLLKLYSDLSSGSRAYILHETFSDYPKIKLSLNVNVLEQCCPYHTAGYLQAH